MNLAQKINELQKKYGGSFFYVYIMHIDSKTLEELYLLDKELERLGKSRFYQYRLIKISTPDYSQYLVINKLDTEIIAVGKKGNVFTSTTEHTHSHEFRNNILV